MTLHTVGTRVYDRFSQFTAEVCAAEQRFDEDTDEPYASYQLRRVGSPPRGVGTTIEVGEQYMRDGQWVSAC